jgi:hypothetical protein
LNGRSGQRILFAFKGLQLSGDILLGIDLQSQLAKMKVDQKLNQNREHQRKLRAQAAKKVASP